MGKKKAGQKKPGRKKAGRKKASTGKLPPNPNARVRRPHPSRPRHYGSLFEVELGIGPYNAPSTYEATATVKNPQSIPNFNIEYVELYKVIDFGGSNESWEFCETMTQDPNDSAIYKCIFDEIDSNSHYGAIAFVAISDYPTDVVPL